MERSVFLDGGCGGVRRFVGPGRVPEGPFGRGNRIVSRIAFPWAGRNSAGLVEELHRDIDPWEIDDRLVAAFQQLQCRVALAEDSAACAHDPSAGRRPDFETASQRVSPFPPRSNGVNTTSPCQSRAFVAASSHSLADAESRSPIFSRTSEWYASIQFRSHGPIRLVSIRRRSNGT